jgi:hypothetical protein
MALHNADGCAPVVHIDGCAPHDTTSSSGAVQLTLPSLPPPPPSLPQLLPQDTDANVIARIRPSRLTTRLCAALWSTYAAAAIVDMFLVGTATDCLMRRPDWGGTWMSTGNCSDASAAVANTTVQERYRAALPDFYDVWMAVRCAGLVGCVASLSIPFYGNVDWVIVRILAARIAPWVLMVEVTVHIVVIVPVYMRLSSVQGSYSLVAFFLDETLFVLSCKHPPTAALVCAQKQLHCAPPDAPS